MTEDEALRQLRAMKARMRMRAPTNNLAASVLPHLESVDAVDAGNVAAWLSWEQDRWPRNQDA